MSHRHPIFDVEPSSIHAFTLFPCVAESVLPRVAVLKKVRMQDLGALVYAHTGMWRK